MATNQPTIYYAIQHINTAQGTTPRAHAGSEYKIDASYLSPNVNMASRLEAATKQFGLPLLLSEDFVECLSSEVRSKVRTTWRSPPAVRCRRAGAKETSFIWMGRAATMHPRGRYGS